jgi:N-methylhydantoinase A
VARYRVGIDIGGTFTDLVVVDVEGGTMWTEKTLTTPDDLWEGIATGLERARVSLDEAEIAHGTTVVLNTLLERRGEPTGLITTVGFRDAYEIGRGARPEMYNLFYRKPAPLVPREHRLEVRERLGADGAVVLPLEESDVRAAAEHFRAHGISDVAVCFLHAYRNPDHEQRAAEVLGEVYPEALVSLSHQLVREWREYERTSTTCINAYVRRRTGSYLERAIAQLTAGGYRSEFFINQSSGGVVSARTASAKPVVTLMSGPAGGVAATARAGAAAGTHDVIAFDMGGTSTDVAVISGGQPRLTADTKIEGHPIAVPTVDIHSIGAGGGSLAWVDEVGALNVGPRSAGAVPGPACYGRGGTEPTVTDANVILGRVAPSDFIPDQLVLDDRAAADAVDRAVAAPLQLTTIDAALGIVEIVNLKMAMAVRAVTVQRGLDPKDFVLYAFGGAGAGHACWIARELGIPRVVVPVAPGQFSALGIALTDVRHDYVRTILARAGDVTPPFLAEAFASVGREAREALAAEGVPADRMRLVQSADVRYSGQEYTIAVPLANGAVDDATVERLRADFHRLHQTTYGHASEEEPVEVVNVRIAAIGLLPEVELPALQPGRAEPSAEAEHSVTRTCFAAEGGYVECRVFVRERLVPGNVVAGPAVVADAGATTVLPPGCTATVDRHGQLEVDVGAAV